MGADGSDRDAGSPVPCLLCVALPQGVSGSCGLRRKLFEREQEQGGRVAVPAWD